MQPVCVSYPVTPPEIFHEKYLIKKNQLKRYDKFLKLIMEN